MSGPALAVVVGNPKPRSRTAAAALHLAGLMQQALPVDDDLLVVDLADHAPRLFDQDDPELNALTKHVASCSIVVVASPTYKATYTGLLKGFFDRYGDKGLSGVVAVALMTGAGAAHALAPEVHLRPLLVELGAAVPTSALYLMESQLDDLDRAFAPWLATARAPLRRLISHE